MMPIDPIVMQRRLVEVGRIRLGSKKVSKNGKEYPSKLETFRLTSRDKQRLDAAAALYGGEVVAWNEQWELFTTADSIPVVVVPGQAMSQSFELWGQKNLGNGKKSAVICLRRCDGVTEALTGDACLCAQQPSMTCKPTTRLSVVLTEVPGLGVWRCESHGWNAAAELAGSVQLLEMLVASGRPVRARLRLDKRESKTETETRQFVVPVLDVDHTLGEILGAVGPRGELEAGEQRSFTPVPTASLPAAPTPSIGEQLTAEKPQRAPRSNAATPIRPVDIPPRGAPPIPVEDDSADDVPPPDEGSALPTAQRVAIAARDAGLDDDGRHDLAEWVSQGRTRSSKDLSPDEVVRALEGCRRIKDGTARLERHPDPDNAVMGLVDSRFGWQTVTPEVVEAESAVRMADGGYTLEEVRAMKGPQLVAALQAVDGQVGGTVAEMQERLMTLLGIGEEPF